MKIIYLTYRQSRIFRVFCIVISLLIEIINFILKPFSWLKIKAHITLFFTAVIVGVYLYLTGIKQGVLMALVSFVAISIIIAFIKLTRNKLEKLRLRLIRYTGRLAPMYIIWKPPSNPIKKILFKLKGK